MSRGDKLIHLYDTHGEKVRYLVVGVCNTAVSYLGFLLLLEVLGPAIQSLSASSVDLFARFGTNYYVIIQWIGWALMVPVSTTTMKYFAFRRPGRLVPQIGRGYLVYFPAQILASVILWLTVRVLHLTPAEGQLIVILVVTVFTYLGHKYFTFRTPIEAAEFGDIAEEEPAE